MAALEEIITKLTAAHGTGIEVILFTHSDGRVSVSGYARNIIRFWVAKRFTVAGMADEAQVVLGLIDEVIAEINEERERDIRP